MKRIITLLVTLLAGSLSYLYAQEQACGERRILANGSVLNGERILFADESEVFNEEYDSQYYYPETGSVTLDTGFVAKPGFSIKPSLNCNQTRPPLEELIRKYAPEIRHHPDEVFHMSSVEWFLDRAKMVNVEVFEAEGCLPLGIYCENFTGLTEGTLITENVDVNTIGNFLELDPPPALTIKPPYNSYGDINSAKVYVHVQPAYYQSEPYMHDDIEIQYWVFYPWNGEQYIAITAHEGDWEVITVVVDGGGALKYVYASQHGDHIRYLPDHDPGVLGGFDLDLNFVPGTDHPIIYSAKKSHAMYNKGGGAKRGISIPISIVSAVPTINIPWDYTSDGGEAFQSWLPDNLEIVAVHPSIKNHALNPTNPDWLNFKGFWGLYLKGPRGPVKQDLEVWNGAKRNTTYQYLREDDLPLISGAHTLNPGIDYEYSVLSSGKPEAITWTTSGPGSPLGSTDEVFTTGRVPGLQTGSIHAKKVVSYDGFEIEYDFSKEVWLGPPTANAFSLQTHVPSCFGSVSIDLHSVFTQSSVEWDWNGNLPDAILTNTEIYFEAPTDGYYSGEVSATVHNEYGSYTKTILLEFECDSYGIDLRPAPESDDSSESPDLPDDYLLYPNPAKDQLNIVLPAGKELLSAVIYTINGEEVASAKTTTISVSNLAAGVYFVEIQLADGERITKKVIVSRD